MAEELERLASNRLLWPNYDPLSIPLAIFDGSNTYLFRHPNPPEGFQKADRASVFSGRHPAVTANTSAEIGGVLSATLLLDELQP
ncbi:hypothetical protein MJD09_16490, partial [bacterium]|nr:hypothetical protein [bacterium]